MPGTVTSGNLGRLVKIYYDRRMLERMTPQLMFYQFGVKKDLPKREGDVIYWHRWNLFTYGRLLAESGAGGGRFMSATRVSAQLCLFGEHAKVTTYLDMVAINSVVEGAIDLFADNAALTVDYVTSRKLLYTCVTLSATLAVSSAAGYIGDRWQNLSGGTAKVVSTSGLLKWQAPVWPIADLTTRNHALSSGVMGGGATGLCARPITPFILRQLALKLKVKNALKFEDGYYKAIIHPDKVHELRSSSAFIDLHKYTESGEGVFQQGNMRRGNERGLVGVMEGFKFYESSEAPWFSTSGIPGGTANGLRTQPSAWGGGRFYFTFFFGKAAYGITDFDGGVRTFIKTPGPQSTDNPLDLYSTVGYRCIMTAKVLNPSACLWLVSGRNATNVGQG